MPPVMLHLGPFDLKSHPEPILILIMVSTEASGTYRTCADPESFVRGGHTLISFFRRAMLQRTAKAGNYRPVSETPLKWRFTGGPIMAHR